MFSRSNSSNFAFAAILGDGSVVSWGDSGFGGDSTAIQQHMINVRRIQASGGALAAILNDGSVLSWGDPEGGGDSRDVQSNWA